MGLERLVHTRHNDDRVNDTNKPAPLEKIKQAATLSLSSTFIPAKAGILSHETLA